MYVFLFPEVDPDRAGGIIESNLVWEHLRVQQEELENVARQRDVGASCSVCSHCDQTLNKQQKMDGWKISLQ